MSKPAGYILEKEIEDKKKIPTEIKKKIFFRMLMEYVVFVVAAIYITYMHIRE